MSLSFSDSLLPVVSGPPPDSATGSSNVHQPTPSTVMGTGTSTRSSTNDATAPGGDHSNTAPAHQRLDFVGSAGAVKDLFALPYVLDRTISVAVHNLGGTLLIDAGDLHAGAGLESAGREAQKKRRVRRRARSHEGSAMITSSTATSAEEGQNDDHNDHTSRDNSIMTQSLVALSDLENSISSTSEALTLVNTLIQHEHAYLHRQKQQQQQQDTAVCRPTRSRRVTFRAFWNRVSTCRGSFAT